MHKRYVYKKTNKTEKVEFRKKKQNVQVSMYMQYIIK